MIQTLLLATQIFVNGHALEASAIETNGTLYVPVDAIARALGVDVTIRKDTVHISNPVAAPVAVPVPSSPAPPARPWSDVPRVSNFTAIRGKLSWSQSVFMSNPPDRGAQVWLVPEDQAAALAKAAGGTSAEPIPTNATGWPAKLDAEYKFLKSVADEEGRFGFDDVAPGSYTLIFASKRSNGLAARDRHGKMRFKKVTVHTGEIADASLNFGVTAYKD